MRHSESWGDLRLSLNLQWREMENNSQSWFFHLFVLWSCFFFFWWKVMVSSELQNPSSLPWKSEHIKSSPFYVNDEEGPWLGGELTQTSTGGLLISPLDSLYICLTWTLMDESSQHNLHIIDKTSLEAARLLSNAKSSGHSWSRL